MKYSKTIDVIFIHPKHRNYVIWHEDCFYQLARMELTQTSWERRTIYEGSLDEIFVAKESCQDNQAICVAQLDIRMLPSELHGVTASKFLAWWIVNRYHFWKSHAAHLAEIQAISHQAPTAEQATKTPVAFEAVPPVTPQNHEINPSTQPKNTSTPHHPPIEELSGEDIFDALFDDLMEEINHAK